MRALDRGKTQSLIQLIILFITRCIISMMTIYFDTLAGGNSAKSTLKERDKMPEHKDQGSSNQGNVRLEIPDVIDRDPRQIVNRPENHKGKQVTVETQNSRKPNRVPLL